MSKQRRRYLNTSRLKYRLNREVILDWRLGQGLTQREAAKIVGLSPVTYTRAELGRSIQPLSAMKLADRLKIPLRQLAAANVK